MLTMANEGAAIKAIVRRAGHSRGLTRKAPSVQRSSVCRVRSSSQEAYLPQLDEQGRPSVTTARSHRAV